MSPEQISRFRTLILERIRKLTAVEASRRDGARPVELDQARVGRLSRQDALQSQALSQAALQRNRAEVVRLRGALTRIDEGEYGFCAECGEGIPTARLEIDPAGDCCVRCAEHRERP